ELAGLEAARGLEMFLNQGLQDGIVGLTFALGATAVPLRHAAVHLLLGLAQDRLQIHHAGVAAQLQAALRVPHVGHATGHAGCKVAAHFAQNNHGTARHVFATMIAYAFHNRAGTGVTHGKAFTGHAVEVSRTGQGAVKHGIAHDDVVRAVATKVVGRAHDNAAAGQAFTYVVIGFTHQIQGDALRQESAKALTRCTFALNVQAVVRQTLMAVFLGEYAREHGTDAAVAVTYG